MTRNVCYIDDLIKGLVSLDRADAPEHDVYNIRKENERTIEELAHEVLDLTDTESDVVYEPFPKTTRVGADPYITRAKTETELRAGGTTATRLREDDRLFQRC